MSNPRKVEMVEVKLRALLGLWDDREIVVAGVKSAEEYETLDVDVWEDLVLEWKERAPAGMDDWREVWMTVEVPANVFAAPTLPSKVEVPADE